MNKLHTEPNPCVAVVGGAGFIGTNLCRDLEDLGVEFNIFDIRKSKTYPDRSIICDIRDLNDLNSKLFGNVVIHLAAVHRDDVRDVNEYFQTNVCGTENLARSCRQKGITKIIFTSSVAVYGDAPVGSGEDAPLNPTNDYGVSKKLAETVLVEWQGEAKGKRSLVIVRPTVVFGEGNRGNIYNLVRQIESRKFIMIGRGQNIKSVAYVKNLTGFITNQIFHSIPLDYFNYVDEPSISMNEFIDQIHRCLGISRSRLRLPLTIALPIGHIFDFVGKITNKRFAVSRVRLVKFVADSAFSGQKAHTSGFVAPYGIEAAMIRTIDYDFLNFNEQNEVFFVE